MPVVRLFKSCALSCRILFSTDGSVQGRIDIKAGTVKDILLLALFHYRINLMGMPVDSVNIYMEDTRGPSPKFT